MISPQFHRRGLKRILIDVHTQYDLIFAPGQEHGTILRNIKRLMAWRHAHNIPMVSLALTKKPETTEKNCVEGTPGQKKIDYTVLTSRKVYGAEVTTDMPKNVLQVYHQVVFNIPVCDPFSHPRADRLLTNLTAREMVIFGVGINDAIKYTALGFIKRGKTVFIITDAMYLDLTVPETSLTLRKLTAKGAILTETASVISGGMLQSH